MAYGSCGKLIVLRSLGHLSTAPTDPPTIERIGRKLGGIGLPSVTRPPGSKCYLSCRLYRGTLPPRKLSASPALCPGSSATRPPAAGVTPVCPALQTWADLVLHPGRQGEACPASWKGIVSCLGTPGASGIAGGRRWGLGESQNRGA
jgi:hypothetical protein